MQRSSLLIVGGALAALTLVSALVVGATSVVSPALASAAADNALPAPAPAAPGGFPAPGEVRRSESKRHSESDDHTESRDHERDEHRDGAPFKGGHR